MKNYENLKYLRKKILKISQEEFSHEIGISRSNLGSIETGRVTLTERVKNDICKRWNVRKEWLEDGGADNQIFRKLTEDEEVALCASELLEGKNDKIYNDIIEFIKLYRKLDDTSKAVIHNLRDEFLENIKNRKS